MTPTREDWADFIQDHWEVVQLSAINNAVSVITSLDPKEIAAKILLKGKEFGKFDPEDMNLQREFTEEMMDACAYESLFLMLG